MAQPSSNPTCSGTANIILRSSEDDPEHMLPHQRKAAMKKLKAARSILEIDGRTGEGGGQLVRIACAIASVITQPLRITNIRGNRDRGGGLKAQHVASIEWLARVTDAEVNGLTVGSTTLEFKPRESPATSKLFTGIHDRTVKIAADSAAASTLLIFQAIFPFLLFAGGNTGKRQDHPEHIDVEISGGTNVSFSLSYEYLDQVLLPNLEQAFGIVVERKLKTRGWNLGKMQRGTVAFRVHPIRVGDSLRLRNPTACTMKGRNRQGDDFDLEAIDVSIVAPTDMHGSLSQALVQNLGDLFPDVEVIFKPMEDSGANSRIYVLLVACSWPSDDEGAGAGAVLRWGRDILTSMPKAANSKRGKNKGDNGSSSHAGTGGVASMSESVATKVARALYDEVSTGGVVDEFLQDQLVIFQALASGLSAFPRGNSDPADDNVSGPGIEEAMAALDLTDENATQGLRKDKTAEPFGEGTLHAKTARWMVSELLPNVKFYNKGKVCEGVGFAVEKP
ncbi:RNA 3'-terminal phosphate cyclase/enolpyruvate transferase [Copromyces sp. CBS 386.78]|nr:RNA 3'-terminal phosphate cyclase/enolpyruvate transferase [Copromyces sp. CBS 386.78]